jgi:hypothetical protein
MAGVAVAALLANGAVALLLYRFRTGDANMRSVWICSRNDAIGNAAVLLAAAGVFGSGTGWPDIIVAAIMAGARDQRRLADLPAGAWRASAYAPDSARRGVGARLRRWRPSLHV